MSATKKPQKKPMSFRVHQRIADEFAIFEMYIHERAPHISQADLLGAALLALIKAEDKDLKKLIDEARMYDTAELAGSVHSNRRQSESHKKSK